MVITVIHVSSVIIVTCIPRVNGSGSTAPTYIRFVYSIDNLLIGHGNTNEL